MINIELATQFKKLFEDGFSIEYIAKKYSTYNSTVRRAIIRAGGTLPRTIPRKHSKKVVEEWASLYTEGKNISEIAQIYNVTPGIIQTRMMVDFNIQMRRKRTFTESHKQNLGKSLKGRISPNTGITMSDEQKEKISKSVRKTTQTLEMREYISKVMKGKLSGSKHPAWLGGISQKYASGYVNRYPAKFNKALKIQILSRDLYICHYCKCKDDLTVHHIDYDKHNCTEYNLITACRSCNSKFNTNRTYWAKHWQKYQDDRCVSKFS